MTLGQFVMAAYGDKRDFTRGDEVVGGGMRRHDVGGLSAALFDLDPDRYHNGMATNVSKRPLSQTTMRSWKRSAPSVSVTVRSR